MVTVTAVYERDDQGRWMVHLAEEPRCHTWARSFAGARREILDAADLWIDELGIDSVDDLEIRDEVKLPGARHAQRLAKERDKLAHRLEEVRGKVDDSARQLIAAGVSTRDVADLLGISAGRVSQIAGRSRRSA